MILDNDPLILLTGATGFVGQRIRTLIEQERCRLRILSRQPLSATGKTECFRGDITDMESCRRAMKGVQKVIHAAGEKKRPELMAAVNVRGTENLLKASLEEGVGRFVHVSSVGVLGADILEDRILHEEAACHPQNGYEKSKVEAEQKVFEAMEEGLTAVILRPVSVFGEGDPNFLNLARFVQKGRFFFLGGRQAWINVVFVDDVAAACLALSGGKPPSHTTYHLSCDIPLQDFVETIADGLGVRMKRLRTPSFVVPFTRGLLRQMRRFPSLSGSLLFGRVISLHNRARYASPRLNDDFGYQPPVGWRRGVERMIAFYRAEGLL